MSENSSPNAGKPSQRERKFMSATEAKKNAKVLRKAKEKPSVTVDMLLSPAGLTQLGENFEKLHANMNYGKDTELMLRDYEGWSSRLCPGLDVDTFVEHCEKLSGHSLIRETLDNANGRVPKKKKAAGEGGPVRKRKKAGEQGDLVETNVEIQEQEQEAKPGAPETMDDGLVLNLPSDILELSVGDDDED